MISPKIVFGEVEVPHAIVEAYPDSVQANLEAYERQISEISSSVTDAPYYMIVAVTGRWKPGQIVRVAFNGGDKNLYKKIEDAATEWTKPNRANLTLEFKDKHGKYYTWNQSDINYSAEIRVAFSSGAGGGYWSHVGTNSTNKDISSPGETSLNLEKFDVALPNDWKAVVIHEFGHAIGFQHEHQNPTGGCDFRFDDDTGYVQTKDSKGWYTNDPKGRRPGLYTYLGGKANYWPQWKVDSNLKSLQNTQAYLIGGFDKNSIMKYFFNAFMFQKGENSPCFTKTENIELSELDIKGANEAYPTDDSAIDSLVSKQTAVLQQIILAPNSSNSIVNSTKQRLQLLQLQ